MKFKRDPITKLKLPTKEMLAYERNKYPERYPKPSMKDKKKKPKKVKWITSGWLIGW